MDEKNDPILARLWWWFYNNTVGRLQRPIRSVACFFLGHDVQGGDWRCTVPDWCARCWYNDGEANLDIDVCLPGRIYIWLMDREWEWFLDLDEYLYTHHQKYLPGWWEY